jgi:hypothetical protein
MLSLAMPMMTGKVKSVDADDMMARAIGDGDVDTDAVDTLGGDACIDTLDAVVPISVVDIMLPFCGVVSVPTATAVVTGAVGCGVG